ncbi:hypothetical protein [Xenorhabdus hominickii]|uniref:Bacteriophage protein n=1 Tax=Xenorhabdus hominickii TaxID=351679 RepID=A0A2G0PZ49_XENHO|nr:hypothetical protein [Xenorhabdus hominickii]AOM42593.1 hypothetical protein A9255_19820 [Xenorhabdus hominickii]PHM52245.1 bacteriophage protein [Xenorhabdus hominickii]PHM53947.1 bacteriophage protein [Xenorhabdus hominickii]
MIIASDLLRAALVCIAKGEQTKKHPGLTGVHITRQHLEATNGHVAVRMELTEENSIFSDDDATDTDLVIQFWGNIPEKAVMTEIQLGEKARAVHFKEEDKIEGLTHLEIIHGRFPDLNRIIPTEKQNVVPPLLAKYLAYPAKMFDEAMAVKIEPSGMESGCLFRFDADVNKLYGNPVFVVMPCRENALEIGEQKVRELEADRD